MKLSGTVSTSFQFLQWSAGIATVPGRAGRSFLAVQCFVWIQIACRSATDRLCSSGGNLAALCVRVCVSVAEVT